MLKTKHQGKLSKRRSASKDAQSLFREERDILVRTLGVTAAQRFLDAALKMRARHMASEKDMLRQLHSEGILTKSGRLSRNYGG
ncbi:MAG TPA: hypothetical protein DCL54_05360 [Alphaproteobacteria bacterium]|nr:hypothetical protein [Alphaproteobacteria bacterium]HAJ45991.1 hypothetical protein [Alphaproteobacteria bacterium]